MMKRFGVALAALFAFVQVAMGAGLVPLSLQQVFDSQGKPLNGCRLYTYQAATTTPQSTYQDSSLSIPWPNPVTCDAAGRLPQMFASDGTIKLRLESSSGVVQLAQDNLLIFGPSSGGGGGSPVDPTTIAQTGDLKVRFDVGVLSGYVRANGRTIGSATSGATERANADTQTLFLHLWNLGNVGLTVSGGRGTDAASDWAANKTITLPDWRGRALVGLDDMGNTASGRITLTYCTGSPNGLGINGSCGSQTKALSAAENGPHTHTGSGTTGSQNANHRHLYQRVNGVVTVGTSGPTVDVAAPPGGNYTDFEDASHGHPFSFTTQSSGTGTAFGILNPMGFATVYLKL